MQSSCSGNGPEPLVEASLPPPWTCHRGRAATNMLSLHPHFHVAPLCPTHTAPETTSRSKKWVGSPGAGAKLKMRRKRMPRLLLR
ncbi:hypothetical protein GGQ11_002909 [Salinibacter ruber]|nr:hypothetical protein [Salinibacter ruber]MCS3658108.1 hypothetical protein [Salinibacter ruber]MCS3824014.1 hypothetical protein [Salinibacter ruber]